MAEVHDWAKRTASKKRVGRQKPPSELSYAEFADRYLWIADKQGETCRLVYNEAQLRLIEMIERQERERGFVRIIVVKARQLGVTTAIQSVIFKRTISNPNRHALTVCHDDDTTRLIFGIGRMFYDMTPATAKPKRRYSTRTELDFSPSEETDSLGAWMRCRTAGAVIVGHGITLHDFHGSEVAYYDLKHPGASREIMKGVKHAMPRTPGTLSILESTGRGTSGWFYDAYQAAKQGRGDYEALFIPWTVAKEYAIADGAHVADVDADQEALAKHFGLTPAQLAWRRAKIADIEESGASNAADEFAQQFPLTDEEAFVAEGVNVFGPKALKRHYDAIASMPEKGSYRVIDGLREPEARPSTKRTPLVVWEEPKADRRYVIGVDVAGGGAGGVKEDHSCAIVLERRTLAQVACWHGRIDPDLLGYEVARIGFWYRKALVAVEINNRGLMTVRRLEELHYPALYYRQQLDAYTHEVKTLLGWLTSVKTKPYMLDDLGRCLREGLTVVRDKLFLDECRTLVRDDRGKIDTQGRDRVMAYAIAIQAQRQVGAGMSPEDVAKAEVRRAARWAQSIIGREHSSPSAADAVLGTEF